MSQYQSYITSSDLPSIHPNQDVFPFTLTSFPQTVRDILSGSVAVGVGFGTGSNFTGEVFNHVLTGSFVDPFSSLTNKIRIVDQNTEGDVLSPFYRIEKESSYDYTKDSNRLNIVFSQTKQINKDIIGQLGNNFSLDEQIGNPEGLYSSSYDNLKSIRKHYFSKYQGRNNIKSFLSTVEDFDLSVLKMVEKVIPGRVNSNIGVNIEPSILERNKIQRFEPTVLDVSYSSSINLQPNILSETIILEQNIDELIGSGSNNVNNDNIDLYALSETYTNNEGYPVNYESGLTLSTLSTYKGPINLDYTTNLNITNPNSTSTLAYLFDSLIPFNAPPINLSPNSNNVRDYFLLSNNEPLQLGTGEYYLGSLSPVYVRRTITDVSLLAGSRAFEQLDYNLKYVVTSSYFNLPNGSDITIAGTFFQPNLGAFGLGNLPELQSAEIVDNASSLNGWSTSSLTSFQLPYFSASIGNTAPYPHNSSQSPYINVDVLNYANVGDYPFLSKYYPSGDGERIRVGLYLFSNILSDGDLSIQILQNNKVQGLNTIPFSTLFNRGGQGVQQNIEFISVSSSFQLRFSHNTTSNAINYRIDTITTASYSAGGYVAPYARIRILSGSYANIKTSSTGQKFPTGSYDIDLTEIASTGFIKAPNSFDFTTDFNFSETIVDNSYTNAFLEIEFYTSKSFYSTDTNVINNYNNNPIRISNLTLNAGQGEEKFAFRIEKIANLNLDNIDSSEVINKDDPEFYSFLNNEIIPTFQFSIAQFESIPNRLKPSYNVFTASKGPNAGLVEYGNLLGKNYVPIDLSIGETEEDDLPNFYNINGGVLIPTNINIQFKNQKEDVITFVKSLRNTAPED